MANVQKYTRVDVSNGSLTRHFERATDENGEYHQWGNQDIDSSRSCLNYNLAPIRDGGQLDFINERLSQVKCHKRADVNIMCSWIITAPKRLADNEHELFFRESYDFLNSKYSSGDHRNVISAYVHMDETTPHMHFAFIPVVVDRKKRIEKVSAKEALGWSEKGLHKFHKEFHDKMTVVFGRDIGVLNEATKDGNKEIWELKRDTAIAEARAKLESELNAVRLELEGELSTAILELEGELREVKGKVAAEKRTNILIVNNDDIMYKNSGQIL